ncbi:hypothetical protein LguiA_017558 [Lonicera macranthoides]
MCNCEVTLCNATSFLPLRVMKKNCTSFRTSGAYTSPGTPEYGDNNVGGIPRGWCSERVPTNSSRRHISAAALMPFNSGRALPSKWDDAERWITSPVTSYGVCHALVPQPHRRPKSKSGPLGTPGVPYFPNYSPALPMLEGGSASNFTARSPFSTGVLVADGVSVHYGGGVSVQSNPVHAENGTARSTSVPRWSDLLSESSLPSSQDEKLEGTKDVQSTVPHVVSRRDVATQMSPVGSTRSSPKGRSSFSTSPPSIPTAVEPNSIHSSKLEVRDVQVDKGTDTKQSKRHRVRMARKGSPDVKGLASPWLVAEAARNTSRLQREEAKINAWENLQKAKAEAAIQKLEMKLEKKRLASMDKILKKLRAAQMKAQEVRRVISESPAHRARRTSHKVVCFSGYVKMASLGGCFACDAY